MFSAVGNSHFMGKMLSNSAKSTHLQKTGFTILKNMFGGEILNHTSGFVMELAGSLFPRILTWK